MAEMDESRILDLCHDILEMVADNRSGNSTVPEGGIITGAMIIGLYQFPGEGKYLCGTHKRCIGMGMNHFAEIGVLQEALNGLMETSVASREDEDEEIDEYGKENDEDDTEPDWPQ